MRERTGATRRAFLAAALASGLPVVVGRPARAAAVSAPLRFLKIRHSTFLVEMDGIRALFDPCFSRDLGLGPIVTSRPPAMEPERVGRHELLLVTSGRPDHFDARGVRQLGGGRPWCFVPDDDVARDLRDAGHKRVRVVVPGDVFQVAGVEVSVSPSQDGLTGGRAVGYRLSRRGRTLWHTGAPPPLDVFSAPLRFAREHESEVVLACWDEVSSAEGRRLTMSALDGQILAALASARVVIPAHDDGAPSWLGGLVLRLEPGPGARSLPGGPRVVVAEQGLWYRVAEGVPDDGIAEGEGAGGIRPDPERQRGRP